MPTSGLPLLGLPIATLALALGYPAQGRHAVVLAAPAMGHGQAIGWLLGHGASIAGSGPGGTVVRIPDDMTALKAAAAGLLIVAVPGRNCGTDGESA